MPPALPRGGTLLGPFLLLVVWELASLSGILPARFLAAPTSAAATGLGMLVDGSLVEHLGASAKRAYLGLGIGVCVAVVLALAAGLTRTGEALIDGLVQGKRAIPTLAFIPFGILWLGIGDGMKVAIIAVSSFVPVYVSTHAALRAIDLRYVELARTLGLSRTEFVRRVALPGALPGFFTGLRLSVTTAWTALVVLEEINTTDGIGYMMSRARDYGQTDVIVVGIMVYAGLGLASDALVRLWERRTLSYRRALGR